MNLLKATKVDGCLTFVEFIRHGDELAGMMSQERIVDALSLYPSLAILALAHRGGKTLQFQGDYLEEPAKLMGLSMSTHTQR
jgi:class 3 adenylate cyclase